MDNLIAFGIVAAALVASPGPDTILILKNTMINGRLAGFITALGVQIGVGCHILLSIAGLSSVLYYSPTVFRLLAFTGALYLAYIGYLTAVRGIAPPDTAAAAATTTKRAFMQGMLCNLLNPKVIVLFVTLMPTFVDYSSGNLGGQIIILGAILLSLNIPFQAGLVLIAARVYALLNSPHKARLIQWLLGGVLMFFAVLLFIEHVLNVTQHN